MKKEELINKINEIRKDLHDVNRTINFILSNPPKYKVGDSTKIGVISNIEISPYDRNKFYTYGIINNNSTNWFDEKTLDLLLK